MTTLITDKNGVRIETGSVTNFPNDRKFRNAWKINGSVIEEDLDTAKDLFRDKIREVRASILEEQDVQYMRALENDDTDARTTIAATKAELRNAPADAAIDAATNIAELKASWNVALLGDSPYA